MRGRLLFVFLSLMFAEMANAQVRSSRDKVGSNYYGFGAGFGITTFFGDIDEGPAEGDVFKNNIAYKLSANITFDSQLKLSGSINFGKMSGDKKRGNKYHLYFKNSFVQYTFDFAVNFVAFFTKNTQYRIMVFGGLGIGLIDFRTTLYNGKNNSIIQSFGKDGEKSTTEFALPLTMEVMYHLSKSSAVFLQTSISSVDTDKLDGLSGNNNRDYYNYLSIGYTYKLPVEKKRILLKRGAK